ncbi:hypothetical protein B0H10DRAFT_2199877 [Mycena sp. CBHHK59/15]|nr:hypothetical protein B0H10DRAFT_2199877 [Mycena sp. CBHHK59/15]
MAGTSVMKWRKFDAKTCSKRRDALPGTPRLVRRAEEVWHREAGLRGSSGSFTRRQVDKKCGPSQGPLHKGKPVKICHGCRRETDPNYYYPRICMETGSRKSRSSPKRSRWHVECWNGPMPEKCLCLERALGCKKAQLQNTRELDQLTKPSLKNIGVQSETSYRDMGTQTDGVKTKFQDAGTQTFPACSQTETCDPKTHTPDPHLKDIRQGMQDNSSDDVVEQCTSYNPEVTHSFYGKYQCGDLNMNSQQMPEFLNNQKTIMSTMPPQTICGWASPTLPALMSPRPIPMDMDMPFHVWYKRRMYGNWKEGELILEGVEDPEEPPPAKMTTASEVKKRQRPGRQRRYWEKHRKHRPRPSLRSGAGIDADNCIISQGRHSYETPWNGCIEDAQTTGNNFPYLRNKFTNGGEFEPIELDAAVWIPPSSDIVMGVSSPTPCSPTSEETHDTVDVEYFWTPINTEKVKLKHVWSYLLNSEINLSRIPWPVEEEYITQFPDQDSVTNYIATKNAKELVQLQLAFHPDKWARHNQNQTLVKGSVLCSVAGCCNAEVSVGSLERALGSRSGGWGIL